MGRNRTGYLLHLGKVADPKILIGVEVAGVALCGIGVGAQETQRGFSFGGMQHNRIARQLDIEQLMGNFDDVSTKDLSLCSAG